MPADLLTVAQYEARLGRTLAPGAETDQVEAFLADASAKIRRFIDPADPDAVYPDAPAGVPADLLPVVFRIVHRAVQNPLGLASETDGTYTWRRDAAAGNEGVYLSPADKDEIRDATGAGSGFQALTLVSPYSPDMDAS